MDLGEFVWNLKATEETDNQRIGSVRLLRGAALPIDLSYYEKKKQQLSKPSKRKAAGSDSDESKIAAVCSELDPTSQFFANAFKKSTPPAT